MYDRTYIAIVYAYVILIHIAIVYAYVIFFE
jgi:hypothetical protein